MITSSEVRTELIESTNTRYKNTKDPVTVGRDFANFIESIRFGLNNAEFEKKIGMANAWLFHMEKKNKSGKGYIPSVASLITIADKTGTDIGFLLGVAGWEVDAEGVTKPLNFKEMDGVSFINELTKLYKAENESIEAFSRRLGITPPTYRTLRDGKTELNKVTRKKILSAVSRIKRGNESSVTKKKKAPAKAVKSKSNKVVLGKAVPNCNVSESDVNALMEMNNTDFCEFIMSYKKEDENLKDYVKSLGISDWTFYKYKNGKSILSDEKKRIVAQNVLLRDAQSKKEASKKEEPVKILMPSETSKEIVEALKEEMGAKALVREESRPVLETEKKFVSVEDVCKVFSIDKGYAEFIIASHYDEYKAKEYINEDNTQLSVDGFAELICKCGISKNDNGDTKAIIKMLKGFFGDNGASKKELARVTGELNKALTKVKVLESVQRDFEEKYAEATKALEEAKKSYDTDLVKYKKILSIVNGTDTPVEDTVKATIKKNINPDGKPVVVYREISSKKGKRHYNKHKSELPLSSEEQSWYNNAIKAVKTKTTELIRQGYKGVSNNSLLATVYKRMTDRYSVVWVDENHKALDEWNFDEYASFSPLRLCALDHSEGAGNKRSLFLSVLADIDDIYACTK